MCLRLCLRGCLVWLCSKTVIGRHQECLYTELIRELSWHTDIAPWGRNAGFLFPSHYKCVWNKSVYCCVRKKSFKVDRPRRRRWCECVHSAVENDISPVWCVIFSVSGHSEHLCLDHSSVRSFLIFSDDIIYETPNLIKFYNCLVWELTFYYQTSVQIRTLWNILI